LFVVVPALVNGIGEEGGFGRRGEGAEGDWRSGVQLGLFEVVPASVNGIGEEVGSVAGSGRGDVIGVLAFSSGCSRWYTRR
jgi:hypothetical protein